MRKALSMLVTVSILVYLGHYFWTNGWEIGWAKLGGPPNEVARRGERLLSQHETDRGLKLLEFESSHGNILATLFLASDYERGQYLPKDPEKALTFYRKLSDAGESSAANEIGFMYYCGQLGAPDLATARQWFAKAAASGNKSALKSQEAIDNNHPMRCAAP